MSEDLVVKGIIEETIISFIKEKKSEEKEAFDQFPNVILREDMLDLLDRYCTVIYYPLENEVNNGFHIKGIPDRKGNLQHFVFINTHQTIEKQVFTAGHELGHVWNVDIYVQEKCNKKFNEEMSEKIINRFAAELLMPADQFKKVYKNESDKLKIADGQITIANMLKVIVALMNQFCVPHKAVVYRLVELKIIEEDTAQILLGKGEISYYAIQEKMKEIISELGYIRFQKPTEKKWIEGLAELLDRAEKSGKVSEEKISNLRKKFDLEKPVATVERMQDMVSVKDVDVSEH